MLQTLVKEARKKQGLSVRALSNELGLARITITRIEEGRAVDVDTLITVCKWLGVKPASVINAELENDEGLAAQISALLQAEPRLKEVFGEALDRVLEGTMSAEAVRDLIAYAAYKFDIQVQGELVNHAHKSTNQSTQ